MRETKETIPKFMTTIAVATTVPIAQINKNFSARTKRIIQLPRKRPHMNNPKPATDKSLAASRAFIQPSSTT